MESVAALAISVVALVASVSLTVRQIRLARGGNHLPVVLAAFKESRSRAWFEAQEYILHGLRKECPPDLGYCRLPAAVRDKVNVIGLFFDDLGKLVAHGIVDEGLIIGSYGPPITDLWDELAPYVYEERQAHFRYFWVYFEDLAARAAAADPEALYASLALRRRPAHAINHSPISLEDHLDRPQGTVPSPEANKAAGTSVMPPPSP